MVVTRLRLVLTALAVGALLALGASCVAAGARDAAPASPGDEHVVAVSGAGAGRTSVAEHVTRVAEHITRAVSLPVALVGLGVASLGALWAAASGLVGRRRRRIGDVGDAWRSLLLGAPPALA